MAGLDCKHTVLRLKELEGCKIYKCDYCGKKLFFKQVIIIPEGFTEK